MKLEQWDPDLRTIYERVKNGEIDLQPNFQRGLVWPHEKKARLIDTLLRGWSIPPVHFLVQPDESLAVLDGQQRLAALCEFRSNRIPIGLFEPRDLEVQQWKGRRFEELPLNVQRRIDRHKIASFRMYEFTPEEPYELFFRLNLPTGLTSAEKRNALVGATRSQVKNLMASSGLWSKDFLGFSNNRMSYEDVIARVCILVEHRRLDVPLNSKELEHWYRSEVGFSPETLDIVKVAMDYLHQSLTSGPYVGRFNKARLLSLLLVSTRCIIQRNKVDFTRVITAANDYASPSSSLPADSKMLTVQALAETYKDRASLRVMDVRSIVVRDFCLWQIALKLEAIQGVPVFVENGAFELSQVMDLDSGFQADTQFVVENCVQAVWREQVSL